MSRAFLDVVTPTSADVFPLPSTGVVRLGSAPESDLRLAGAAPTHLTFDVQRRLMTVQGPGVRVGGEELGVGQQFVAEPGELITVGTAQLAFVEWQQTSLRRVSTHDYFDQRATEECIRAQRKAGRFSMVNVRVRPTVPAADVEAALAGAIRLTDVLSMYATGVYEILLFETEPAGGELVRDRLGRILEQLHVSAGVGVAHFPVDGRSVDELGETAAQRAVGESGQDPAEHSSFSITVLGTNDLVDRVAQSELNVLILGETGSGKEVLAARVHRRSRRADKPFLKLNCAAFTESLLESELFGHEKGSFTGAHAQKSGLLETANGGSVFLDEIGEMPLTMQSKLLRVLEDRTVMRVGGLKAHAIDVRFIAATNRDLEVEVNKGRFRADLYFRLDGSTLVVPPLRERLAEFDQIAKDLLAEAARRMGRPRTPHLSDHAMSVLKRYHWPGNIRELRNVLERAVMLCDGEEIARRHLPLDKLTGRYTALGAARPLRPEPTGDQSVLPPAPSPLPPPPVEAVRAEPPLPSPAAVRLPDPPALAPAPSPAQPPEPRRRRGLALLATEEEEAAMRDRERRQIEAALQAAAGNQTRAARALGISRRTLIKRIEAHGIARPRMR